MQQYAGNLSEADSIKRNAYRKIWLRIIPLLFLCYGFAFIDRINIGFTKLQMSDELGINATWYGIAAGAFFITYAFAEIPSNLVLAKWGAPSDLQFANQALQQSSTVRHQRRPGTSRASSTRDQTSGPAGSP